jgi:acyl carrier protein
MKEDMRSRIEERIRRVLADQLGVDPSALATSSSSTPLLGRGIGLDSIETLTLVVGIEGEFDILVDDAEFTGDLFKNIGTLAEYILQKTSGQKNRPMEAMSI